MKFLVELDMESKKIVDLATPTADTDAATKKYVDDNIGIGNGDMLKSVYDTDDDGTVDSADTAATCSGNAATVTTNANLTGGVTSVGNAATVVTNANLTGDVTSVGNATTIGAGKVTEAMQVLADNTTNNFSTTKHGYVPKGADSGYYLKDDGTWSTPAGAGDVSASAVMTDNTLIKGDGGSKGVQDSGIIVDDSNNVSAMGTLACNEITIANGHGLNLQEDITFSGGTGVNFIIIPDNLANALQIKEGTTAYLTFVTTDSSEKLQVGKTLDLNSNYITNVATPTSDYHAATKKYVDDQIVINSADVTADAVITDHTIVRGHGGARIVQDTGITIDDSDNIVGVASLGATGTRLTKGWFTDLETTNMIDDGPLTLSTFTTDHAWQGETLIATVAESAGLFGLLYLHSTGYKKAKADADTTLPCVALQCTAGTGVQTIMKQGYAIDASWSWTKGDKLWVSPTTAGLMISTDPTDFASGTIVQMIGYAEEATKIYFNPQYPWVVAP